MSKSDNDTKELNLMISVVKKYYELNINQEQIAKEEYISKSSVCRLLKRAFELGIVTCCINYPVESVKTLEDQFYKHFKLNKVYIAPTRNSLTENVERKVIRTAAEDICKMIKYDDILTVNWGNMIDNFADELANINSGNKKCNRVVLMNGSLGGNIASVKSGQSVEKIARFFGAKGYILPAPLVVDSPEIRKLLCKDSHIVYIIDMIKKSRISIMSIGGVSPGNELMRRSALNKEEYDLYMSLGAVGDLCGWYFDIYGNQIESSQNERTISLPLTEIREKEKKIGIAIGQHKVNAIIGALRGEFINILYTDELTAQSVIETLNENK